MTKKVVLPKDQAEAIECAMIHWGHDHSAVLIKTARDQWKDPKAECLNHLKEKEVMRIAQALINGYEVEPSLEVGSFVKHFHTKEIGTVTKIQGNLLTIEYLKLFELKEGDIYVKDVESATVEEIAHEQDRRKWAAVGREIGTFKKGDIVYYGMDEALFVVRDPDAQAGGGIEIKSASGITDGIVFAQDLILVAAVENQFEHGLKL
jgi:ribosomal protein L21E